MSRLNFPKSIFRFFGIHTFSMRQMGHIRICFCCFSIQFTSTKNWHKHRRDNVKIKFIRILFLYECWGECALHFHNMVTRWKCNISLQYKVSARPTGVMHCSNFIKLPKTLRVHSPQLKMKTTKMTTIKKYCPGWLGVDRREFSVSQLLLLRSVNSHLISLYLSFFFTINVSENQTKICCNEYTLQMFRIPLNRFASNEKYYVLNVWTLIVYYCAMFVVTTIDARIQCDGNGTIERRRRQRQQQPASQHTAKRFERPEWDRMSWCIFHNFPSLLYMSTQTTCTTHTATLSANWYIGKFEMAKLVRSAHNGVFFLFIIGFYCIQRTHTHTAGAATSSDVCMWLTRELKRNRRTHTIRTITRTHDRYRKQQIVAASSGKIVYGKCSHSQAALKWPFDSVPWVRKRNTIWWM